MNSLGAWWLAVGLCCAGASSAWGDDVPQFGQNTNFYLDLEPLVDAAIEENRTQIESLVGARTYVLCHTDVGDFWLMMLPEAAPLGVPNFLSYADANTYDGMIVHRVDPNIAIVQSGSYGYDAEGPFELPAGAPIPYEYTAAFPNERGSVAYARTNDPDPATDDLVSATSGFFLNARDNNTTWPQNNNYSVFAWVTGMGMEVVDWISQLRRRSVGISSFQAPYRGVEEDPVNDWVHFLDVARGTPPLLKDALFFRIQGQFPDSIEYYLIVGWKIGVVGETATGAPPTLKLQAFVGSTMVFEKDFSMSVGVPALFPNQVTRTGAWRTAGGWKLFNIAHFGPPYRRFVFTPQAGWFRTGPVAAGGFWMSRANGDWLWTRQNLFPVAFNASKNQWEHLGIRP